MTFTVTRNDYNEALKISQNVLAGLGAKAVTGDTDIAKVSVVGVGMRSHAGVALKMFEALSDNDINIIMISTSEIKISCVIDDKHVEKAVQVLHQAFELGENPSPEQVPHVKQVLPQVND